MSMYFEVLLLLLFTTYDFTPKIKPRMGGKSG